MKRALLRLWYGLTEGIRFEEGYEYRRIKGNLRVARVIADDWIEEGFELLKMRSGWNCYWYHRKKDYTTPFTEKIVEGPWSFVSGNMTITLPAGRWRIKLLGSKKRRNWSYENPDRSLGQGVQDEFGDSGCDLGYVFVWTARGFWVVVFAPVE